MSRFGKIRHLCAQAHEAVLCFGCKHGSTDYLPPLLGWLLIGGGVFLLGYSALGKKD